MARPQEPPRAYGPQGDENAARSIATLTRADDVDGKAAGAAAGCGPQGDENAASGVVSARQARRGSA